MTLLLRAIRPSHGQSFARAGVSSPDPFPAAKVNYSKEWPRFPRALRLPE
ncbi:hypothetical protein [Kaistia sp. UC242_56]